jgi:hypothetical protein
MFYNIKPLIPRALQIILRRQLVLRKRKSCNHIWSIDEKAGKPPNEEPFGVLVDSLNPLDILVKQL